MSAILVGMFDTKAAAEAARSGLVSGGFQPSAVRMNNEADDDSSTSGGSSTLGGSSTSSSTTESGGLMGWLSGIFGGDDADDDRTAHAERYKEAFRRGAFGLTVATSSDNDTDRACDILNAAGAIDIDERSRTEGWSDTATGTTGIAAGTGTASLATTAVAGAAAGTTQTLKVVEENLAVGKRSVARGGVRVYSRVVEVPVEESVRLREEHTNIERRVVDRPATEADFAAFKEGTIEVRDMAEEAVVGKTARVVGEVEIGQQVTERDEVVRDTVRKTEVDVEQLPVGTVATPKDMPKL